MFPGLTGALGPCILSKVPVFGVAQSGRGLSFAEALETLWGSNQGWTEHWELGRVERTGGREHCPGSSRLKRLH